MFDTQLWSDFNSRAILFLNQHISKSIQASMSDLGATAVSLL